MLGPSGAQKQKSWYFVGFNRFLGSTLKYQEQKCWFFICFCIKNGNRRTSTQRPAAVGTPGGDPLWLFKKPTRTLQWKPLLGNYKNLIFGVRIPGVEASKKHIGASILMKKTFQKKYFLNLFFRYFWTFRLYFDVFWYYHQTRLEKTRILSYFYNICLE